MEIEYKKLRGDWERRIEDVIIEMERYLVKEKPLPVKRLNIKPLQDAWFGLTEELESYLMIQEREEK